MFFAKPFKTFCHLYSSQSLFNCLAFLKNLFALLILKRPPIGKRRNRQRVAESCLVQKWNAFWEQKAIVSKNLAKRKNGWKNIKSMIWKAVKTNSIWFGTACDYLLQDLSVQNRRICRNISSFLHCGLGLCAMFLMLFVLVI